MATETKKRKAKKPVVKVEHSGFQPSVAQLREDVAIDVDPEYLALCLMQDVEVKTKPKD